MSNEKEATMVIEQDSTKGLDEAMALSMTKMQAQKEIVKQQEERRCRSMWKTSESSEGVVGASMGNGGYER